jgi:hypothetical protein
MSREDQGMTASTDYAKIVRVRIERSASGAYFASSPDVPGFEAVSRDRKDLEERLVPKYLADLYKAAGQPMMITRLDEASDDDVLPWVRVPVDVARRELERQAD